MTEEVMSIIARMDTIAQVWTGIKEHLLPITKENNFSWNSLIELKKGSKKLGGLYAKFNSLAIVKQPLFDLDKVTMSHTKPFYFAAKP